MKYKSQLVFSNLFVTVNTSIFSCYDTEYFHFKFVRRDRYINFYYYITVNIGLYLDSSTQHTLVDSKKINGALVLIKILYIYDVFFWFVEILFRRPLNCLKFLKMLTFLSISTYLLHYEKLHFRYFLTTNKL